MTNKDQEIEYSMHIKDYNLEIDRLQKQNKDLQCCGNCKKAITTNIDMYCEVTGKSINSHKICNINGI